MASENNKRIAKNTLMLYLRMLLTMGVSLYTVRVVLDTLGVIDYGLYNVVAGIVTMFSFFSGTMASASQRFFSFEIGRKNYDQLKRTFSITMLIYLILAVVILVLAETVGLWFLNNKMTIPPERMEAARWVYHFSILSFMMTMFTIPYNAAIIAHERMNIFAWVSIIEVTLKLLIVYLLVVFPFDKLKLYAVLMFGVTTLVTFTYRTYCQRKFSECRVNFYWEKNLFKEIISYSGWNLFGALAIVLRDQGVNIVLNLFFNPVVNAARGIAFQINQALLQFTSNFYMAVKPQIMKSYAAGHKSEMHKLVFQSSKFGFFLMLLLVTPILIKTEFIISLWLKQVPQYTIIFTKLLIINALIDVMNVPIVSAIQATGRIKAYQLIISIVLLLNLPLTYLLLRFGFSPQTSIYISISLSLISYFPRLLLANKLTGFSVSSFLKQVVLPCISVLICTFGCLFIVIRYFKYDDYKLIFFSLFFSVFFIYRLGLTKKDRKLISNLFLIKMKLK